MRRNRVTDRWGRRALFARRWSGCIVPWRGLLRLSLPPPPPKCRCRRAPSGSWGWSRRRKRGVVAVTRSRSIRRSISQAAGAKPYFKNFGSFPLEHMPRIIATATITTSDSCPPDVLITSCAPNHFQVLAMADETNLWDNKTQEKHYSSPWC